MARLTALYDACVLYPAPLRDLLMRLAMTELFRARWTATIHDEWTEAILRTALTCDPTSSEHGSSWTRTCSTAW